MQISRIPRHGRCQRGVGLIEVLIAVLVLAIGLLGIAAMQSVTLKNSGSAAERTQAMIEVYAMLDLLRANKSRLGSYNTGGWSCAGDGAPSNQQSDNLQGWLEQLRANVAPSACGSVNCPAAGNCTVRVRWDDTRATGFQRDDDGDAVARTQQFEITTQL